MLSKNSSHPVIALFFLLALLFSFLNISKIFIAPHCLAFDDNDDANHTFINLQQWRRILSQGEWPTMNVYNNFGAPLIGDAITYPLSPLSLTYAIFPGPVAMTVNRVLIGFFSLFLLFIFYHRRFPAVMSIGLALCAFYAPGFLWNSAHHHFQMSLPVLTAFFLLQERFTRRMSMGGYFGICVLSILMFISVSFNEALILCVLIFGYQVFLSGGLKEKSLWFVLSGLACGMAAVFPDILLFLQATSRSIRRFVGFPVNSFYWSSKIYWTPIVAAGIYSIDLFRERRYREGGVVFWLGVVPFCIVLLSRVLPLLWNEIPLLGATDVVRLTWGAQIFLLIGCGGLLSRWLQQASGWRWEIFICLLAIGIDALSLHFNHDLIIGGKLIFAVVWVLVCAGFGCGILASAWKDSVKEIKISRWMVGFVSVTVVVFYLYYGFFAILGFNFPRVSHVPGLGSFSTDSSEKFPLPSELSVVPKNSRVAYDFNTISGLDLRGAREGLFGAGARSTIMTNSDFSMELFKKGLIKFDSYTGDYHFCPPWRAKELQDLGIAYVVQQQNNKALVDQGWKPIRLKEGDFLYQNPLPAGVVFLKKGKEISPLPFIVKGNGLDVELPLHRQEPQQLVISLLRIPGWRAWIDGREAKFLESENKFLVLSVSPKEHSVRVRYEPLSLGLIFLSFFIALTIPWIVVKTYIL